MSPTSRRTVLVAGASAIVVGTTAGALPAPGAAAAPAGLAASRIHRLYRRKRFATRVGTTFELAGKPGRWKARLVRVADLPGARAGDERCFGLTFEFAGTGPGQGTYLLRRRGFTTTELFVVPAGADRQGAEAIVNSL